MPIGPWTFIVYNCFFGLCFPQEEIQIGTFKDELSCHITATLYDDLREVQDKSMGYPYFYSKSECFNWIDYLHEHTESNNLGGHNIGH